MYKPTYTVILNTKMFNKYRKRLDIIKIVRQDKHFVTFLCHCDDEGLLDKLFGEE